ncbi:MAG: HDOD domain-containing protein [Phycisphaerales bacterium]
MAGAPSRTDARRLELILERIQSLPTLSTVAQKLMSAGSHDEVDIGELTRLIEADPSLTGKVLSMCRSADKGLGDKITSVQRAITLLGLDAVTSAVLSVEVFEILSGAHGGTRQSAFDAPGHWRHAIAVATAAELIAAATGGRQADKTGKPETAFVAGLLHSIGRIAMEIVLPDAYGKVLTVAMQRGQDSAALERDIIGLDHAAAGKRLAEHWGLPRMLRDCVWLHGQPILGLPDSPHRALITKVIVARALCRRLNLGWAGDFSDPPDVHELCVAAEIDPAVLDRVTLQLAESVAQRCQTLGLDEVTGTELMLESVLRANTRLAQLNHSLAQRSSHGEQQRTTLKALRRFAEQAAPGGLSDVLSAAARSARDAVHGLFAGAVVQAGEGEPWQAMRFNADGTLRSSAVEPAPVLDTGEPVCLADAVGASAGRAQRQAVLPWMAEHIADNGMLHGLRVIPLPLAGVRERAAALLIVDEDFKRAVPSEVQRGALTAAWGAAVSAALRSDADDRLAGELAARHRELAEAQSKLAEARSMTKLGEMTAGAAHELNNPLAVIKGYGQILRKRAKESALREPAEKIAEAAQQLSDLITSLHLLAEPPTPEPVRTALIDVLNDAVQQARERTRATVSARMAIPDQFPAVRTDGALLARALAELVSNAAESESSEIIEIRVQTDPLDDRLLIVVKDRGRGMEHRTLQHAFEPFFSERPAGRGTGLGLARARRLVDLLGGTVTLASEPGEGTRATVTLPAWRVEAEDGRGEPLAA